MLQMKKQTGVLRVFYIALLVETIWNMINILTVIIVERVISGGKKVI
jgi:hypothetical protein